MDLREDIYQKNVSSASSQSQRILIIEKDRANAMWLCEYLLSKGFDVSLAMNFAEGLNTLQTRATNGIFLSLDGMGTNGLNMVELLRTQYPQIPMFVMSEMLNSDRIRQSFAEGVKGFISKPILYDHLQEVLFEFAKREDLTCER